MKNNENLFNAAIVGENPNTAFIVEGSRLHAIEQSIANQKKDKSDPKKVLPLMREALEALVGFAEGKIADHFLEVDWDGLINKPKEQSLLIERIHSIYSHLPHHDRNELSSLIHHKQGLSKENWW